jgi:hypothetical protein
MIKNPKKIINECLLSKLNREKISLNLPDSRRDGLEASETKGIIRETLIVSVVDIANVRKKRNKK